MKFFLPHYLLLLSLLMFPSMLHAEKLSLLLIDGNSFLANKAVQSLDLPPGIDVRMYTNQDIVSEGPAWDFIMASDVVIVDVMGNELSHFLIEKTDFRKKRIYALRAARDDEFLKKKGFIFDDDLSAYYSNMSADNLRNLIRRVVHHEFDSSIDYKEAVILPDSGIYHPGAESVFRDFDQYMRWYVKRPGYQAGKPFAGLTFFSTSLAEGQVGKLDYLIQTLEEEGFNVVPAFGRDEHVIGEILTDKERKASRVDVVVAFTLKFSSCLSDRLKEVMLQLDVPFFNAINLYSNTIEEWREDPVGISPMNVVWTIVNPEISGLIEPTPLAGTRKVLDARSGREVVTHEAIRENVKRLIPRLKRWVRLRKIKNSEKRVAILYYNHSQGKQNIGASYLNVFKSLERILGRMKGEGYVIEGETGISEKSLKELVLKCGRNVGSWAPGELDKMLLAGKIVRLPVETYNRWFEKLPVEFQKNVMKQWGRPEESGMMIKNGEFVIPALMMGNVAMMPEPSRGLSDNPMKLYHDTTLYPNHQYIAAYLWLEHGFHADAMIHLGTHATYEWLPGKQAGLSPSCPPEVMVGDIPNLYPYIVDDVGEGIQAKRRGRGVIIDHLVPAIKKGGQYEEYGRLSEMISRYGSASSLESDTAEIRLREIGETARELGLGKDLGLGEMNEEALEEIEHYLLELKENLMPFGLHTFGVSPEGVALDETVQCIVRDGDKKEREKIRKDLIASGENEMDRLMKGLNGGYIPAGEGNDPIRNPASMPTGKNFYGFSPDKVPSPAAWELGKKAAREIIEKSLKEKKEYPQKVAVVLWATETIRNEGISESTILYLMGVKPRWDKRGRVVGVEVIPGTRLNRPRIDVLINPSSLYRDLFPEKIVFLDQAVQKALVQNDVENLLRKHTARIRTRLMEEGVDAKKAEEMSRFRIFTEEPGSYGNGVAELTGMSGFWKSDEEIVRVFEKRAGFAFGDGVWGQTAQGVLRENLKGVDVALHSISSNIIGTMDNDDMFSALGGLSLAAAKESGKTPATLFTMARNPEKVGVEDVAKTIGRELRTRYLNPVWIKGMKKEDYAGAREMSKFVEYMWGWQVTTRDAVDAAKWKQTYEVYVEDKYGLEMKEFFNRANPWAYQSITARMLEAIRKGYWTGDEEVKTKLAVEYAVNIVEKGVACCDHTCNNPLLNQMVVNIISLPGVMSPEMVEQFKMAVEKATGKTLDQHAAAINQLHKKVNERFEREKAKQTTEKQKKEETGDGNRDDVVEGYKMEKMETEEKTTELASSGIQWFASLFVLMMMGVFAYGAVRGSAK